MRITRDFICSLLPKRVAEAHKGAFGHVFVIAGSRGFTGAAKLASLAAARSGTGLVTVGIPEPLADVMANALTEIMSLPLPATEAESLSCSALEPAMDFASDKDAVVLGPGLSQHRDTQEFVREFVKACPIPMLVDADGLNALGPDGSPLRHAAAPRVLTPHPGEMGRLTGMSIGDIQKDRQGVASRYAKENGCVLVLKGYQTVVADEKGTTSVNPTGNAGLATGGTGDVLSGLGGGLLAQGLEAADAARLAVYVHGLAGDIAAERMTQRAMIAGDLLEALGEAWRRMEKGTC